jgi:hypothetical protein
MDTYMAASDIRRAVETELKKRNLSGMTEQEAIQAAEVLVDRIAESAAREVKRNIVMMVRDLRDPEAAQRRHEALRDSYDESDPLQQTNEFGERTWI